MLRDGVKMVRGHLLQVVWQLCQRSWQQAPGTGNYHDTGPGAQTLAAEGDEDGWDQEFYGSVGDWSSEGL